MILIAYKSDAYKEYLLPNTDKSDYTVLIDKKVYGFKKDVNLHFEINDNVHTVKSGKDYKFKINGKEEEKATVTSGAILSFTTKNNEKFFGIFVDNSRHFEVFEKIDLSQVNYISIGQEKENVVSYDFNGLISKFHCELKRESDGFYINDYSANGIFCNHKRLPKRYKINFGDDINVFGLHLVFLGNILCIGTGYGKLSVNYKYVNKLPVSEAPEQRAETETGEQKQHFSRAPRVMNRLDTEQVEIDAPPAPKFTKKKPVIYTIGPAFTMAIPMLLGSSMAIISSMSSGRTASAFMFTGMITAVGSAIIGIIWALLNLRYTKQSEAQEEQNRFNVYGNYLIEKVNKIKESYERNTAVLYDMYPSASECAGYSENNHLLWNRNRSHPDFLYHRLGIGDMPFQVDIKIPKEKFDMTFDALSQKPAFIKKEYETLKSVPVGIDLLNNRLYGIIGGRKRAGAMQIMYDLVAQIAANNCYTDVKMAFIYNGATPEDDEKWRFARWLPHVWSADKKTRYLAANKEESADIFYELVSIFRERAEEGHGFAEEKKIIRKPYYIIFIEDAKMLDGELISKYLLHPEAIYGVTTFILSEYYTDLPNECEKIIEWDSKYSRMYDSTDINANEQKVEFDRVSIEELDALARRLSDVTVNEIENTSSIPTRLDFLEMYGANSIKELNITERWRKNRTFTSMSALVGKKAGGTNCYLDIHEKFHGPHGLVAGTTGSGKSELLQTYILSLAVNYSPEDVAIFIIDYKGGGMANLFSDLPHMVGQISNLSGNQVRRAMISIKSENRRRQRLFNECGVNSISNYTRLYKKGEIKTPIPHLFIIIDEFAELKKEEPDFMRELISVAQVGRSLGVHLILATQKPSGTVDDNIWSNSKFRICLRVQDRQDSNDMLHKPDAAYITQAGRAYLQVGNDEIYELFQSGWSGAPYNESAGIINSSISSMLVNTGKTALVGNRTQIKQKEKERTVWYSKIIECIFAQMRLSGISNASDIANGGYKERDLFIDRLIDGMNISGLEYSDNANNRNALEHLIALIPDGGVPDAEGVKEIAAMAAAMGVSLPEKKEKTQLEVIVNELKRLAEAEGHEYNLKLWLPVLPENIYLSSFMKTPENGFSKDDWKVFGRDWSFEVPIGLSDDPKNQAQRPLYVDFSKNGHLAVCGMVSSGKSTFLQSLIFALASTYSPECFNTYILDFSNNMLLPFERLPHCGGVVYEAESGKVGKFFHMLISEMDRRKKLFGGGNYAQYVRVNGNEIPAWLIVIDNYAGFREKTQSAFDDDILRLAKEGVGYGIMLAVSAGGFGINDIPNRIGDNIRTVISLEQGDKFKYMDVLRTTKINTLPEVGVKGRGLAYADGALLEFQTALAFEAEDDFSRSQAIGSICDEMSREWTGKTAVKIPEIPAEPVWDDLVSNPFFTEATEKPELLPFAYLLEDASVHSVNLARTYCYSVTGRGRTGKTNTLRALIRSAALKNGEIHIFEKGSAELKKLAGLCDADYISDDRGLFDFFAGIKDEFIRRNKLKRQLIGDGQNEQQIFDVMKNEKPIFLFISDLTVFTESVYRPETKTVDMKGFVENIIEKGILHNIYIFACVNTDTAASFAAYKVYKTFVDYKNGVHLGGNVNSQRIFNFQNIPFSEQGKSMKKGLGLTPSQADETFGDTVVIPYV